MPWKTHQKARKIKRKTKLALLVLGLLLVLILLSMLTQFVSLLTRPYNSLASERNYRWDGKFNLNFVTSKSPISFVSYNPVDKKVTIISIPDETLIDVPFGFGKWQLRSIYGLGEGSKIGGENLLKKSVSSFLGVPIDGVTSDNFVDTLRRNIFSGFEILPNLKTDLTLWELILLKINLLQVRFDKIQKLDLLNLIVLEKTKLPDGSEVFIADPIRLDSVMADLTDSKILSEHLSIAIFNATDRPLLAQKAKRLIENLGGSVIATSNAPVKVSKTYIEGPASNTLERLIQIFDQGCRRSPSVLRTSGSKDESKCDRIPKEDLGLASMRAQIILVLGEDTP